jgi:hypothetical protein
VSSVLRSSLVVPVVDQFRDAVKTKYDQPGYLKDIPAGALHVYKNKAAFNNRNATVDEGMEEPLEEDSFINGYGASKKEALVVVVPQPILSLQTYWKVFGIISDSLTVKGVRSRMYRNADEHLGYYEIGHPAFFYDKNETNLGINVLFETKENALRFDSCVRNESITINSPMNSLKINFDISATSAVQLGKRIYYTDYVPTEFESPQDTQSVITIQFSTFEETSDEFKYQRIEKISIFGSMGKAESCHLMSSAHCRNYSSYRQYEKDPNNRLAMSRDLHGWFDHMNSDVPLFYLKVVSISESVIVEGRYRVQIAVVAFNQEAADMIFWRLIEGSTQTKDALVMNTSVHVTNPTIFQKCLEWKEKDNKKKWAEYNSMDSAVP